MIWKLDQSHSEFQFHQWQGGFDLNQPEQGLQLEAPNGAKISELFKVVFPRPHQPQLSDCYTRQQDLIASYPPREARKFHIQLDYRLLNATPESLLVELWISVQTYLLDNHPTVLVRSSFDPASVVGYDHNLSEPLSIDDHQARASTSAELTMSLPRIAVVNGRSPTENLYITWLNHPRDQFDTRWSFLKDEKSVEAELFGHFMEKGVIRRGRMRCWVSLAKLNPHELHELYQDFVASPLPLTA